MIPAAFPLQNVSFKPENWLTPWEKVNAGAVLSTVCKPYPKNIVTKQQHSRFLVSPLRAKSGLFRLECAFAPLDATLWTVVCNQHTTSCVIGNRPRKWTIQSELF